MNSATEQRIKSKLKTISKERNISFNLLLEALFFERFLARLAKSPHKDNLIFKGGQCLAQYINLGRETRDIDFLLQRVKSSKDEVKTIFDEIVAINLEDEFQFLDVKVIELPLDNKKYPGIRLSLIGKCGQIHQKLSIDIGVGDIVHPQDLKINLVGQKIFNDEIDLKVYPPEYIFSEKLEAVIFLEDFNSRMKDYYDLWIMIQGNILDSEKIDIAIEDTFSQRGTELVNIPDYSDTLSTRWNSFLKKNKLGQFDLKKIILGLNDYLNKIKKIN